MPARMIAVLLGIGSILPLVAGIANAESPSWVILTDRQEIPRPSFRSNATPLPWRDSFLDREINQEIDKDSEFLPFYDDPQWQAPNTWCSATGTVV
ncbi:MAG TPA: hypothetical protein VFE62_10920 [Gemmataceae bacterium]|nr:hypothetical protein [Gemmataceae bacterium]